MSAWTRERVLELGGIDDARVALLPNTFDESRFKVGKRPDELIQRYLIGPDERVIVTVARLSARERYKGSDRVIHALSSLRQSHGAIRFIIVGDGDDRPRLELLARELGVEKEVSFAGFVSDDELADYYRLADVFVMPSTGEGFGIVFLEAMGCGTPVVAGNRDGSVDAVDGGRLGMLVDPENVESISAGIARILDRRGENWWYNRNALSDAVSRRFGRDAFRRSLSDALF